MPAGWNSVPWKYTLSEMRRRPGRTLLTLIGIVLGVATVVSISLTTASTRQAYGRMFESLAGRASLEVVAEGLGDFDASLAEKVASTPGLKAVVPVVQAPTVLLGGRGNLGVLVLGVEFPSDKAVRRYRLREGRLPQDEREAILEAGFANSEGLKVGDTARLLTPIPTATGPQIARLHVVGLLEPEGAAAFNGGAVVFIPLAGAQQLFAKKGNINSVQIVLADDADRRLVEQSVRERLPEGLVVHAPAVRGAIAEDSLLSTEIGLGTLSVVSLVAGAFVILNSFLMNLGERRRQLAILRALGTTRSQITTMLLREALILGVSGTLVGCLAGWGLSFALHRVMTQLLAVVLPDPEVSATPFLAGLMLGPGMAIAATYWPALRAGRRAVLPDLVPGAEKMSEVRRWPPYLGLGLIGLALFFVIALIQNWFSVPLNQLQSVLGPVLAVWLVGCVLAMPLVLKPFMNLAAFVLKPVLGMEGGIALRQLERRPTRTALTAGVLLIAVVISIAFGHSLQNGIRDIHQWCDHNVGYDFMVRGIMPDSTTTMTAAPLPENLADPLTSLEGVERVTKVGFVLAHIQGQAIVAIPVSIYADGDLPFSLDTGDAAQARAALRAGGVVLGAALAQRLGVRIGDWVSVESREGPRKVVVAGTTTEYTVGGMVAYMDWQMGRDLFHMHGPHVFAIRATDNRDELAERLQQFCNANSLNLQSRVEFRAAVDKAMGGVIGLFWLLVVLVFIVASLGIVNTLTMNVLEQTRSIGILRAVAMKRSQVRKMIFAQALALGVISLVPGVLLGFALAWLMHLATNAVSGHSVRFQLDLPLLLGCFLVALLITILAGLFPARRAARLPVIEALQYE